MSQIILKQAVLYRRAIRHQAILKRYDQLTLAGKCLVRIEPCKAWNRRVKGSLLKRVWESQLHNQLMSSKQWRLIPQTIEPESGIYVIWEKDYDRLVKMSTRKLSEPQALINEQLQEEDLIVYALKEGRLVYLETYPPHSEQAEQDYLRLLKDSSLDRVHLEAVGEVSLMSNPS